MDAGPAPEDRVFSLGLHNNSGGPPQSASVLQLKFGRGTPEADTVIARRVAVPPTVDGDGADWSAIPASTIPLQGPGTTMGLAKADWDGIFLDAGWRATFDFGIPSAEVKAAFDDSNLYFLVSWSDATEDRLQQEWSFDGGTWARQLAKGEDHAVMGFRIGEALATFDIAGCAAACHVKERLGDVTPAGRAYRFAMHTTDAGERTDVWNWKATRTNPLGFSDDGFWNETRRQSDGTVDFVIPNTRKLGDGGSEPLSMAAGGVNANADYIFDPDAGSPAAVPFDGTGAAPGARIPGYVHRRASPNMEDVRARGKWTDGRWTVEFQRALTTSDPNDAQFPLR